MLALLRCFLLRVFVVEDIAALGAELRRMLRIRGGPAALVALIELRSGRLRLAALGAELALIDGAAFAGPALNGSRLRLAAVRAELRGVFRAAFALPRVRGLLRLLLSHLLLLLLNAGGIEVLSRGESAAVSAGAARHVHAEEAGEGAVRVVRGVLHRGSGGVGHTSGHHEGVGAHGRGVFHLVDLLHILFGEGNRIQRNLFNRDTAGVHPFVLERLVHRGLQLDRLRGELRRTQSEVGHRGERRSQRVDELGLQLLVDAVSGVVALNVAADSGVEDKRVGDRVGIHAVASDLNGPSHVDVLVDDVEHDGVRGAELVAHDLLRVEEVDALVVAGVAAHGETLADELEGLLQRGSELAGEEARLGGGVVDEFAGLAGELNDLALIDDDHELTFVDGDLRAVGNDVVAAFGVAAALAVDDLLSLGDEDVLRQSFAVEEFLPLIGENSAQGAEARFNKSHCNISLYDILVLLFVIRRSAAYIRYIL